MEDKRIAGPLMVSFDVTYQCNYRCLHCFNGSGENHLTDELSDEELLRTFEMIAEVRPTVVCFCGGEPTLRSETILRGCRLIKDITEDNTTVNLVTNGSLMTKELAKNIKDAGFSVVQVSLDGAERETHEWLRNKKGSFESAISAIKTLKEADVDVGISFTPSLKNLHEVEDAIDICTRLEVSDFRIQPLMPLGRALENLRDYMPSYQDYKKLARKLQILKYAGLDSRTRFDWGDPVDHVLRFSNEDYHLNPLVGINAYGGIYISPYIPITFGNIKKHSIKDYWEAGLADVWDLPIVKELSAMVYSVTSLNFNGNENDIPKIYYEDSFEADLIEDTNDFINGLTLENINRRGD